MLVMKTKEILFPFVNAGSCTEYVYSYIIVRQYEVRDRVIHNGGRCNIYSCVMEETYSQWCRVLYFLTLRPREKEVMRGVRADLGLEADERHACSRSGNKIQYKEVDHTHIHSIRVTRLCLISPAQLQHDSRLLPPHSCCLRSYFFPLGHSSRLGCASVPKFYVP